MHQSPTGLRWVLFSLLQNAGARKKKGVCVCPVTLNWVTLVVVLYVLSYCAAVFACVASRMVSCCTGVEAACAALYMVGYYAIMTVLTMLHAWLGLLSQFCCCIWDAAGTAMVTPPKFPEAKSRGLIDIFLLFSFPKGKLKRFFVLFGKC